MERFKGTKGKWFVDGWDTDRVISDRPYINIAKSYRHPDLEQSKANSQLISAAPELLEALIFMRDRFVPNNEFTSPACIMADKAINKAFGIIKPEWE